MFADWSCTVLVHNRTWCEKYRIFQLIIDLCNSVFNVSSLYSISNVDSYEFEDKFQFIIFTNEYRRASQHTEVLTSNIESKKTKLSFDLYSRNANGRRVSLINRSWCSGLIQRLRQATLLSELLLNMASTIQKYN